MFQIHPALSSFPVVLLFVVILLEIRALLTRRDQRSEVRFLLTIFACALLGTYLSGIAAKDNASIYFAVPDEAILTHQALGKSLLFLGIWLVACSEIFHRVPNGDKNALRWVYGTSLLLCFVLAVICSYFGGKLVFQHGAGVYTLGQ